MKLRKKFIWLVLLAITLIYCNDVKAAREWQVVLGENYTNQEYLYYFMSQYSYSFHRTTKYAGEVITNYNTDPYTPRLYMLVNDESLVKTSSIDTFKNYTPFNSTTSNYNVGYCADLENDMSYSGSIKYNKVRLSESDFWDESTRKKLSAIIKNSFPYITEEQMIDNLINAGVLEYVDVNDDVQRMSKKILTAKGFEEPTTDISLSELVSAIQMAIYSYSNPGLVDDMYYNLHYGSSIEKNMVSGYLDADIYKDNYNSEEIENNIKKVYEYLISLEDDELEHVQEIVISKASIKDNKLSVTLSNEVNSKDNLKISVIDDEKTYADVSLSELEYSDGAYIIDNVDLEDLYDVKIRLYGSYRIENDAYVYEPNNKVESQTLIGVSNSDIEVDFVYVDSNPNTGAFVKVVFLISGIFIVFGILYSMKKKQKMVRV